jgi:transposase
VIIWNLLNDPTARFHDLGADYHATRIDKGKKACNYIRQLEARLHRHPHRGRLTSPHHRP